MAQYSEAKSKRVLPSHKPQHKQTDSAPFIEFMLQMILNTIESSNSLDTPQVSGLLLALKGEMSRDELQIALGLQDRKSFTAHYIKPAFNAELIEMTIHEKPNSGFQKYRLERKL